LCCAQFDLPFYLEYLAKWPEYCLVAEGPGQQVMGYIIGKAEGQGENWHGHVTAVTVAPDFRCCTTSHRIIVRSSQPPQAAAPFRSLVALLEVPQPVTGWSCTGSAETAGARQEPCGAAGVYMSKVLSHVLLSGS